MIAVSLVWEAVLINSKLIFFFVISLSFFACGCEGDTSLYKYLIVPGSYDVKEYKLSEEVYQVSYVYNIEFPDNILMSQSYKSKLLQNHWVACTPEQLSWDGYIDASKSPYVFIHRIINYYVRGDELLTLSVKYVTDVDDKSVNVEVPGNSIQYVDIILTKSQDLSVIIKKLNITCD